MSIILSRALLLSVLVCAVSTGLALAKGAPPKLTISGPGLEGAVEVSEWEGLGCIAPGGLFTPAQTSMAASPLGAGYDVVRFAWTATGVYAPFDRLHYYPGADGGSGLIFYDGSSAYGAPSDGEGQWYNATPLGVSAMQQLLRKLGVPVSHPLPAIDLVSACGYAQALEPGEHFDKATVSGPGLRGEVAITDPHNLLVIGQPLSHPFWQTSWNVQPQFATSYEITGFYRNGDAYLSGGTVRYHPHPAGGRSYVSYNAVWYVVAPDVDVALRGMLKPLGAAFAPAAADVASVAMDAPLLPVTMSRNSTLGFTVREPGNIPASADMVLVYLASEYKQSVASVFVAKPQGAAGHYQVDVNLPDTGRWYFWVLWGAYNKEVELTPLEVLRTAPGKPSTATAAEAVDPAMLWPVLAAVAVLAVVSGLLLMRAGTERET